MLYPKRHWFPHTPKFILWISWLICRLVGLIFGIRRQGLNQLPAGPLLVIAPHVNFLDPLFLWAALPRPPRLIADAYFVFKNPILAWIMWFAGVIPVDRQQRDPAAVRQFLRLLANGELCGLFPEGSRSLDGRVTPPMISAVKLIAKSKIPVVNLALQGAYDAWPRWDPILRIPRSRIRVRFINFYSSGQVSGRVSRLSQVHDFKKKLQLEDEQQRLQAALKHAAQGESTAIDLTRTRRPQFLSRLLCFCPQCAEPMGLSWKEALRTLHCRRCGLEWRVYRSGLAHVENGQPHPPRSIDSWFDSMISTLRGKNPQDLIFACQLSAVVKAPGQEAAPEPASLRIDQRTVALRTASGHLLQIPLAAAARGNPKGADVLEINYQGRLVELISHEGHAVTWLILIRKLAGWNDYFSEH